jgi:hypothetical protein
MRSGNLRCTARAAAGDGSSTATNCMSVRSFIDTNVLLYADSADEPRKRVISLDLIAEQLREGSGVVST